MYVLVNIADSMIHDSLHFPSYIGEVVYTDHACCQNSPWQPLILRSSTLFVSKAFLLSVISVIKNARNELMC